MSVNTDAILFFGICLPEDFGPPWGNDWEEKYASLHGIKPPVEDWSEKSKSKYHEYWSMKNELVQKSTCLIDRHCCSSSPMFYVAHRGLHRSASRGYPEAFGLQLPIASGKAVSDIKAFCELMGIPFSEPQWYLASWWSE